MSYITTENLNGIMAEMSDYCNAACPMCNRYDWNLKLQKDVTNKHHTSLDFIRSRIGESILSKLKFWLCQGTYGDSIMNPETIDIFDYLKKINPNIKLTMWTNGGARNEKFWKDLAKLDVNVIFSIDGLEDTNHLYRRNVDWQKLMSNVKTFISNGGKAYWEYLIFKHNQNQIQKAREISKILGFKSFKSSFSERWTDFNSDGEYRDIKVLKVDDYQIEKPENQDDNELKIMDNHVLKNKNVMLSNIDFDFFKRKINCYVCSNERKQIYLRANGFVSPCCFLGDVERNEPKNIITDFNKINLNVTTLEDILNGEFFKNISEGINGGTKRLKGCYHTCGER
jgi:MoaA/NifB/PqqE/SkfB family radical SAM enzyme